jgi:uncharacterized protein
MFSILNFVIMFKSKNRRLLSMFEKHCQTCGFEVDKKTAPKRFGKYFCSDDHAQQYLKKREEQERVWAEEERKHPRRRGGCC